MVEALGSESSIHVRTLYQGAGELLVVRQDGATVVRGAVVGAAVVAVRWWWSAPSGSTATARA